MDLRIPTLANCHVKAGTIIPVQYRLLTDQIPNVRYKKLLRLFLLHIFEFQIGKFLESILDNRLVKHYQLQLTVSLSLGHCLPPC